MVSTDICRQVRRFVIGIREWVRARIILYSEVGSILGRMLPAVEGLKFQQFALRVKVDQGQTVSEAIMYLADLRRLGNHPETTIQQVLIEAVARAEKELMRARPYWSFVPIGRLMMDGLHSHRECQVPGSQG